MTLSRRDTVQLAVMAFFLLFGIIGMSARKQIEAIGQHRSNIDSFRERLLLQKELSDAADIWKERYAAVKDQMPVFGRNDQVQSYWFSTMDAAAERCKLRILQRSIREENIVAGVCELPIEVRSWEGTLQALVEFIHALEAEGAMLEIRELRVSPIQNQVGYLKGSFLLSCAYLRSDEATVSANDLATSPLSSSETSSESAGKTTSP